MAIALDRTGNGAYLSFVSVLLVSTLAFGGGHGWEHLSM